MMTTSPQTNTTLVKLARELCEHDDYVICGHVSPDGDCLGSQLALAAALRQMGKRVACVLARDEAIDRNLAFLPGADELVPAARYEGPCESFLSVDVPTPERLGDAAKLQEQASFTATIDHHAVPHAMSQLNFINPNAASTTMIIWQLAGIMDCDLLGDIAVCAYTGLMTDTGRFQYQNTNEIALEAAAAMIRHGADPADISRRIYQNRSLASIKLEGVTVSHMALSDDGACALSWLSLDDFDACRAVKADAEPLIDTLRSIAGVQVACMLREQNGEVRGSLRAKDSTDVSVIAREFGGGGHKAAAGFTIEAPLAEAVRTVSARLGVACAGVPEESR